MDLNQGIIVGKIPLGTVRSAAPRPVWDINMVVEELSSHMCLSSKLAEILRPCAVELSFGDIITRISWCMGAVMVV